MNTPKFFIDEKPVPFSIKILRSERTAFVQACAEAEESGSALVRDFMRAMVPKLIEMKRLQEKSGVKKPVGRNGGKRKL